MSSFLKKVAPALLLAAGSGVISWIAPRALIAAGVPLDRWAVIVADTILQVPGLVSRETALTAVTLLLGVLLFTGGLKFHLVERAWAATFRRQTPGASTEPELIPLHEAVMSAWERIRKMPFLQKEAALTEYNSLLEYYEADPKKLPSIAAQVIFNHADPSIQIEGRYPPRIAREWIPKETASQMFFSDDATVMFDYFDKAKPMEERRRYVDLKVRSADVERRIGQLEE